MVDFKSTVCTHGLVEIERSKKRKKKRKQGDYGQIGLRCSDLTILITLDWVQMYLLERKTTNENDCESGQILVSLVLLAISSKWQKNEANAEVLKNCSTSTGHLRL